MRKYTHICLALRKRFRISDLAALTDYGVGDVGGGGGGDVCEMGNHQIMMFIDLVASN
jgi:hypothetical protein